MNSQELRALQEAYSQVYDEGYKSFPHGKVEAKAKRLGADSRTNEPLTGKSDSEVDSILARKKKSGERATSLNLASRTAHSYLPQKKAERNKTQKEQVDLYDIILSHLLDEGYADTEQAAEAIMVNMSEEWRQIIVEQSNPYGRGTSPTPMKVSPSHSELQKRAREKSEREGVWLPPYIGPSLPQAKNKTVNNTKPA
jgi:hypothetical protein